MNCGQESGQRHIPQSAFWELMLGVTAWSALPWKKKSGKKDILGIWALQKVILAKANVCFPTLWKHKYSAIYSKMYRSVTNFTNPWTILHRKQNAYK